MTNVRMATGSGDGVGDDTGADVGVAEGVGDCVAETGVGSGGRTVAAGGDDGLSVAPRSHVLFTVRAGRMDSSMGGVGGPMLQSGKRSYCRDYSTTPDDVYT